MVIEITLTELEEQFEHYIDRAHQGERFLIIDHNVMLIPVDDTDDYEKDIELHFGSSYEKDIDELIEENVWV